MDLNTLKEHLGRLKNRCDKMLNHEDTLLGQTYACIMAVLVLTVCTTFVIGTYPVSKGVSETLFLIEIVITVWFLVDYILRWWVRDFSVRYPFTPMAVIDLMTILPLFLADLHWQFVRVLRIFRILRLLRFFRANGILSLNVTELHLRVLRILFTLLCLFFVSSGLIYEVESDQNEMFETFFDALYFSIVALTTVGFGDIVPTTVEGRAITLVMILAAIFLIPWQVMNLARQFVGDLHKSEVECQNCRLRLHDIDANFCKVCGEPLLRDKI